MTSRFFLTAVVVLVAAAPALGGPPPAASAADASLVHYAHDDPLLNPRLLTLTGTPDGLDGCTFQPPGLELGPLDHALSMRQLSTKFADCTTVVEIGVPTDLNVEESTGSSASASSPVGSRRAGTKRSLARAAATSSGYYEIVYEDRANLDLNKTRSRLTWTWNGSCVTSWSPSAYWWWQSWTGWWKDDVSSRHWTTGGCDSIYSHTTGVFGNTAFCGYFLYTEARDVRFRGGYAGGYGGYVGSVTNSQTCQPIHWRANLVKTS